MLNKKEVYIMKYLNEHLKKYPLMTTQDQIKLLMQGIMGPGHLVNDKNIALKRLTNEYEEIKYLNYNYDLFEEISDDYVRVYLKPYYEKNHSFEKLVHAFYMSSQVKGDVNQLREKIDEIKTKDNESFINEYLNSNNILISHSNIYRENYHPHYIVIHKNYLKEI